jgi:hypothetical protein
VRWVIACVSLFACADELSFGRLSEPDAGPSECDTRGPLFPVGDGDPSCPGFHHALCSCGDYVSSGPTRVEGDLALGGLLSAGDLIVDGSLTLAGDEGAALTGDLQVTGSLLNASALQGTQAVTVGGDARIAGDVRLDSLRVGGTFTLGEDAALEIASGSPPAIRAPVGVTLPCNCTPTLDVGAQIDAARAQNDNARIALEPERGLRTFDEARTLDLPCGRYYVDQIYAASPLTLNIHGRVALYIGERIVTESNASLIITVDPTAQLDLFLRQGVTGAGPITITGGETHLYIGGNDSFFFAAPTKLEGTLYAPNSELVTQQSFELTGAALLQRVVAEQLVTLNQTTSSCR